MIRALFALAYVTGGWFAFEPTPSAAAIENPVRIEGGLVASDLSAGSDVRIFKGIPYAAPPTGTRRWRPPQPVVPWEGVLRAEAFGPSAVQIPRDPRGLIYDGPTAFSEDCLSLNIWTPARSPAERHPVLVWIHGGGFTDGAGSLPAYDGEHLARKGVVVVTINYRLNVFGFLAHPELSRESEHGVSGNYGLLDMIAAIQWVRRNIAAFGGDSGHIVIGGLSAGSSAVSALAGSPLLKGAIAGAIAQSVLFGRRAFNGDLPSLAECEAIGRQFVSAAGGRTVDELRGMPAEKLHAACVKMGAAGRWSPIIDHWAIEGDVYEMEQKGGAERIPILTGSVANEGTTLVRPVPAEEFVRNSRKKYGKMADRFLQLYPAGSEAVAVGSQIDSVSDQLAWMHRRWAELHHRNGEPAYLYLLTREPPLPPGPHLGVDGRPLPSRLGAFHGCCKYYSFDSLESRPWPWTAADRRLADLMTSYWANFIARGDPNGPGLPPWPKYGEGNTPAMELGVDVRPIAHTLSEAKSKFWSAFFEAADQ